MQKEVAALCTLVITCAGCGETDRASTEKSTTDAQVTPDGGTDTSVADAGAAAQCGDLRERDDPAICEEPLVRLTPVEGERCGLWLEEKISRAGFDYVFVTLDDRWIRRADGYRITNDGTKLELIANACDSYADGRPHALRVQLTCTCIEHTPEITSP